MTTRLGAHALPFGPTPTHRGEPRAGEVEDRVDPVEVPARQPGKIEAASGEIERRLPRRRCAPHEAVDRVPVAREPGDEGASDEAP